MPFSQKLTLVSWVGIILAVIGVVLRFSAHSLAWPTTYGFSGSGEDTQWGRLQLAIEQCAIVLMSFAAGLLLLASHWWLGLTDAEAEQPAI